MHKNFFYLARTVVELNRALVGFAAREAFSFQKNRLVVALESPDEERALEISTDPGLPYVALREDLRKARKNVVGFFDRALPAASVRCAIAVHDRTIRFSLPAGDFFYAVRGGATNVVFLGEEGEVESFQKMDENKLGAFVEEMKATDFTEDYPIPPLEPVEDERPARAIKRRHPYLGKELQLEVEARLANPTPEEAVAEYQRAIMETVSAPLRVFVEEGDASLEPTTFGRGGASELSRHESAIEATRSFLRERYARKGFGERFKRLDKALAREADKLSSRLHRLEERVNRGSREEEYRRAADLLLANVGALRKGEKSATVEDYYRDGEPTTIKLKENASPQENVDRYYEKARDERVSFERSKTMLAETKRRYDELSRKRTRLDEATQTKELDAMLDELGGGRGAKRGGDDLASKFKQYIIDGKYRLYVGKDGANNDLLTQRFAKPNDYWFHARAVPGSHAVLKIDNAKEEVPKSALKKAASIAAFHSKAKTAGTVPVSCTLKKYVFKRKGAPLGQVQLKREDSLLVRPGVPEGCEFVDD